MEPPPKKSRAVWAFLAVAIVGTVGAYYLHYYRTLHNLGPDIKLKASEAQQSSLDRFTRRSAAKVLIDEQRFEEALTKLKQIKAETTDPERKLECDVHIGEALRGLGKYDESLAVLTGVVEKSADESRVARAAIGAGITRGVSGDLDRAVQELNKVVDRYAVRIPDFSGKALFAIADLYRANGQVGKMRAALARVMDEFPAPEGTDRDRAMRRTESVARILANKQADYISKLVDAGAKSVTSIASGQTVTWAAAEGPYVVVEELTVPADTVLKIEAGTVLRFGVAGGLRVTGRVEAVGTAEKPIRCLPTHKDPSATWWSGFHFEAAGGAPASVLTHVEFTSAESAVRAERGQVTLTECDIRQPVQYGLVSTLAGKIVANQCRIQGGAYEGIRCENGGTLSVDGGRVAEHAMDGITIKTTPNASLVNLVVEKNGRNGIVFRDGSTGRLEKCRIVGNAEVGLLCRGDASPQVADCEIAENGAEGLSCVDRSKPVVSATHVRENKGGGVRLISSDARFVNCQVRDNGRFGIWCKLSSPEIRGGTIAGNAEVGVWILEGGQPRLHQNSIVENKGPAVRNHSSNVIDAAENWWGSPDPAAIAKRIEDREENGDWGNVKFAPALKAPPSAGKG